MTSFRQSTLRSFDGCPLATSYDVFENRDWYTQEQALGAMFHRIAEEVLRTLNATGNRQMPHEEIMVVAREVCAQVGVPAKDVILLNQEQRKALRWMVLNFQKIEWDTRRIMGLEKQLRWEVECPDGVKRTITGTPDIFMADPPASVVVVDFKSGLGRPSEPRDGDWTKDQGRPYLSERGIFQLDCYGFLVMVNYPSVEQVVLREFNVRWNEKREAWLRRDELEHVEKELAEKAMHLDLAIQEGAESERWQARPGSWCSYCPKPMACPVPKESRGEASGRGDGVIQDDETGLEYGAEFVATDAKREFLRKAVKARHESTGEPIPVGDRELRWHTDDKGRRKFGLHKPLVNGSEPDDGLAEAFAAAGQQEG